MLTMYKFYKTINYSQIDCFPVASVIAGQNHISYIYYSDTMMSMMASQITSLTTVYSTVYLGVDQRKLQSSVSLAFMQGIHRSLGQ